MAQGPSDTILVAIRIPDHASDPGVQSPKSGFSGSAEVCAL